MPLSGHCLCKAVTYTVDQDEPLITAYDHCDDCQRQSGSTYSLVAVVLKDKLKINGPIKSYAGTGSSGHPVHRLFCSECGSPIAHDPEAAPEIIALKAGTLDVEIKKNLKPDTEIWTASKLPFCKESRRNFQMSSGTLHIIDSRTKQKYEIPIRRNVVFATDLKSIKAPGAGTDRADHVASGLRVHDPGLQNTTVIESAISYSDHERGVLLFRGYTLAQLWDSDFEDMLHLLVWGTYPTRQQKQDLNRKLTRQMLTVPESVHRTIQELPRTTSPLPLILAGLSAYLACFPDTIPASTHANLYQGNLHNVDHAVIRTVAAYGVIFGLVNSHRKGIDFQPPSPENSLCENLFTMAGLVDRASSRPDPVKLSCFRRFAMLNADHGMALAAFATLVTASSLTDPISCLISAVAAAYGPLHFGATVSAQRTLREIGSTGKVPEFIKDVKAGRTKLFGYGHRSYKGHDPRVRPIQSILKDLDLSSNNHLKIAERIEEIASADEYFRRRSLYPNADFYGNFVFTAIGFDPDMIPAAMLTQRIIGLMAHWREYMLTHGKLFRPSHGALVERLPTETTPLLQSHPGAERYSVFTTRQKRLIILTAAIASTFSPISANIYYPALNSIATDLDVTSSQINLTITTYMICQDQAGRRPAYIISLQRSYPMLLVLRAVQSSGSSGTVALASAVAADIITSAERGTYMSITSLGNILAPSLGPLIGGVLSEYLGWQSIFWFLAMSSTIFFIPLVLFFPETCRTIVGDGSILASRWNKSIFNWWISKRSYRKPIATPPTNPEPVLQTQPPKRNISPLSTLSLLFHLPTSLIFISNGLVFASYYAITAGLPSQLRSIYGLSAGTLLSATFNGIIVDWNYRRMMANGRKDMDYFDVEKARLGVGGPIALLAPLPILLYGLATSTINPPPLALTLTLIFTISFTLTATYNILNILLVDLHYTTPATIMATNNLVRCSLGAAATALVHPCIQRWGARATYCGVAVVVLKTMLCILLYLLWTGAVAHISLLPPDIAILHLRYPETSWIYPRDTILKSRTADLPIISTRGLNPKLTYVLLFFDLDVVYDMNATVALHWYQPDLFCVMQMDICHENRIYETTDGYSNGGILVNQSMGAEYIAPRPPPFSHHRYVQLLFVQKPDFQFPKCYSHIFPPTAEARAGFDIHQFVAVARLGAPVAGNYFVVEYDGPHSVHEAEL
ncbi:citrate synthase-like protein [Aspergillus pseudonomiae]|uniref:Citrate synthase n=1 Tax=Aspergillus pseudonomiae TaxID=1506151 RepID=A0A5N7D0E5_9EURO|nr:citrate synthase-like protein [Aspergillus pseudonomiae]KAE8399567.1 citrate synthase-like protein [Aspergillus pseudonomiae]